MLDEKDEENKTKDNLRPQDQPLQDNPHIFTLKKLVVMMMGAGHSHNWPRQRYIVQKDQECGLVVSFF